MVEQVQTRELQGDDAERIEAALHPPLLSRSTPVTVLLVLALLYTAYAISPVLIPIALAWLGRSALIPIANVLSRRGVPTALSAAIVMTATLGAVGLIVFLLADPVSRWLGDLPRTAEIIQDRLRAPVADMSAAADDVVRATQQVTDLANPGDEPVPVAISSGHAPWLDWFSGASWFVGQLVITLILMFFMLAGRGTLSEKLLTVFPKGAGGNTVRRAIDAVESQLNNYLLTIGMINLGLGVAIGTAMFLLGIPNPLMWGTLAAVLNWVPYLGAMVGVLACAATALVTFDTWPATLAPPLVYATLNGIEGMLVTPAIVGRRMTLSPIIVFAWLLLCAWAWGIPGSFVAVPLLVAGKILCDSIPRLRPIGVMLE